MEKWNQVMEDFALAMIPEKDKQKTFLDSPLVRIVASTPFLAGCDMPERTAIAHLAVLLAASKMKSYADHTVADDPDPVNRLKLLNNFQGGNKKIIQKSLDILVLLMLEGYNSDKEKDFSAAKYNPLNNKKWNYEKMKQDLTLKVAKTPVEYLDQQTGIVGQRTAQNVQGSWWQL